MGAAGDSIYLRSEGDCRVERVKRGVPQEITLTGRGFTKILRGVEFQVWDPKIDSLQSMVNGRLVVLPRNWRVLRDVREEMFV